MKPHSSFATGFTLVEMAVVLIIVGLLLGGLIVPLSAQIEQRNYSDTQRALNEIKDALMGYALSHSAADTYPYFPCPDTDGNGTENRAGAGCAATEGDLPWADLGIAGRDAWNRIYRYRVAAAFSRSDTGFRIATPGDGVVRDAAGGNVVASGLPVIVLSRGRGGAGAGADETENSNTDTDFVSHAPTNTAGNEFDDQVAWISALIIVNRMVTAGRFP